MAAPPSRPGIRISPRSDAQRSQWLTESVFEYQLNPLPYQQDPTPVDGAPLFFVPATCALTE